MRKPPRVLALGVLCSLRLLRYRLTALSTSGSQEGQVQFALPPSTTDTEIIAVASKAVGTLVTAMQQTTQRGKRFVKTSANRATEWLQGACSAQRIPA